METLGIIIALGICYFMDRPVSDLLHEASKSISLEGPEGLDEAEWKRFTEPSGKTEGGSWLGRFERMLAFLSFYAEAEILIGAWLVFKLGTKWQIWSGIIKMPDQLEGVNEFSYLSARQRLGSWLLVRFLTGTLINILIGFVLSYFAKMIFA